MDMLALPLIMKGTTYKSKTKVFIYSFDCIVFLKLQKVNINPNCSTLHKQYFVFAETISK